MAAFLDLCRFVAATGGTTDWTYSSTVSPYISPTAAGAVNSRIYKVRAESADLTQWEVSEGAYNSAGAGSFARTMVLYNSAGTGTLQGGAGTKISFSAAPQVWVIASKRDLLSIEEPNSFTTNQKAQARANIDALKKNYIVNGAMMVSQENGTTAGTTTGYYPVDQFSVSFSNAGAVSIAQVASVTPGGSPNRLRVTVTTADASVAAGDVAQITQAVEGLRVSDLLMGTGSAKTVTVQFGIKAPAGTYCVAVRNSALNRSYVGEYTIAGGEANTDVVKSVTLALDQSGTWLKDTGAGCYITWSLMTGSTFQTTAGSWAAGNFAGSSNQFNFMGTLSNVFELFDVELCEGLAAPSFQVPDPVTERLLCQRYYYKIQPSVASASMAAGLCYNSTLLIVAVLFPVVMRAAPSFTWNSLQGITPGSVATVTGLSTTFLADAAAELQFTGTGWVAGGATVRNLTTAGYLAFNARL